MKKYFLRLLVFIAIVVLVMSPYLLVIDFVKYAPLVLIVWIVSVAYYLLIKRRVDRHLFGDDMEKDEEEEENTDCT